MSIDTEGAGEPRMPEQGAARPVELIATLALALSTLVAVTAVSIGIARADAIVPAASSDAASLAIALLVGLLVGAMGTFTTIMAQARSGRS
jgi:hypothetical protein